MTGSLNDAPPGTEPVQAGPQPGSIRTAFLVMVVAIAGLLAAWRGWVPDALGISWMFVWLAFGRAVSVRVATGLVIFFALLFNVPGLDISPLPLRAAAVTAIVVFYWITNALPIGATALLPMVLFPLCGVLSSAKASAPYAHHLIFLFLGGFIIARGFETWGLHRRIALNLVSRIGTGPRTIMLGFMITTAILSMWISNTATTLMMLPIAVAVILVLEEQQESSGGKVMSRTGQGLLIGIAYAASIGGLGTPIGTAPNTIFLAEAERMFPDRPPITFGKWLFTFGPFALGFVLVAWAFLAFVLFRPKVGNKAGRDEIHRQLKALGRWTAPERWMFVMFLLAASLWIFRRDIELPFGFVLETQTQTVEAEDGSKTERVVETRGFPGWSRLIPMGRDPRLSQDSIRHSVTAEDRERIPEIPEGDSSLFSGKLVAGGPQDGLVAMLVASLMFMIPVDRKKKVYLMNWKTAVSIPWEILLLLGAGFCIAEAFSSSGLTHEIGRFLEPYLTSTSPIFVMALVALLITFLTEMTSNTATSAIVIPILGKAAGDAGIEPMVLMLPAILSASFAFMLPIATPPNAVVFSSGRITIQRLAMSGIVLNLVGVAFTTLFLYYVVLPAWGLDLFLP